MVGCNPKYPNSNILIYSEDYDAMISYKMPIRKMYIKLVFNYNQKVFHSRDGKQAEG
jgi:hypothetical protein